MMNDCEEDIDDFPANTKKNRRNLWLEHIAQMYKGQLNRESLKAADGVKYF